MPFEIERKFRVVSDAYKILGQPVVIRQGFLSIEKQRVIRVRVVGEKAFLTIKGISIGASRMEFEYEIPLEDARFMLENLCSKPLIEKTRYKVGHGGFTWEVDEFHGENEGLVIAEIELEHEGQEFPKPDWLGEEVTGDASYYNANLVEKPFKSWK